MSRPKAPWTELIRSLPSTMTIAEMAEHARSTFPEITNAAVYSSRSAAGLEFKHVLPPRKGIKYKQSAAKKFQAKNGHAKLEPATAKEAMALIQKHKDQENQGPTKADMEAAMKQFVIRYGTENIIAFCKRLQNS